MATKFHAIVVDDTPVDMKVAKKFLENSAFQVTTFNSPMKALDFLATSENSNKIDLIVTDYEMPGMTGLDLMKRVQESSSSWVKNIPVVVMSSESDVARECLANGAHDFIPKPFKKVHADKLRTDLMSGAAGPSGN